MFRIVPDREEENSKTLIEREVIIPDWVMQLLDELKLERYNEEHYIFSTRNKYGTFMPGMNRMHSNTPTRWWRKIVKEDLKLDVNQYSLKKLAGNDMVRLLYNERVNDLIKLPQQQMGHTTSKMTETYVHEHKNIENEILKRKMPVL
jgi:integrase